MSSVCLSVCPFVRLSVCDVGGSWPHRLKSWKLIARTISTTSLLFVAQRSSAYSQGNMEKFWVENVCSTLTSMTSGWIESTESHVIVGGGVAVCLLLSVHRAVIFAIAQLSCYSKRSWYPSPSPIWGMGACEIWRSNLNWANPTPIFSPSFLAAAECAWTHKLSFPGQKNDSSHFWNRGRSVPHW